MSFKAGPLQVVSVGGTDRQGGGDGPAILLCHGFGAPAEDLVPLARVIDVRASSRCAGSFRRRRSSSTSASA
jgi:hypothetical protein